MLRTSILIALAFVACVCGVAAAQDAPAPATPPDTASAVSIEERLAWLETAPGLDEAAKTAIGDVYRSALEEVRRAALFSGQAAEFRRLAAEVPERLTAIRGELANPPTLQTPTPPPGATLSQVEQSLAQASADLDAARLKAAELQAEAAQRNERRTALPEQIARARRQLADADDPGAAPAGDAPLDEAALATRAYRRAHHQALTSEVESLEAEAASYDARRELLPARRDRAQRRIAEAERTVAEWQALVTKQRISEADRAAEDARRLRREAARQHPVLQAFADETAERANARAGASSSADRIDRTSREATEIRSTLGAMRAQFASIQRRLDASGLNRATGLLLRRQYEALPETHALARRIKTTQQELERAEYTLVELQEERLGAGDIDRVAQELGGEIAASGVSAENGELEQIARELASARRDLLDQLLADATATFENLVELNTALRDYAAAADTYRVYIEERILWVRSVSGDRAPSAEDVGEAIGWLVSPTDWKKAREATLSYARQHIAVVAMAVLAVAITWAAGFRLRLRLRQTAELVSRYSTDAFRHTLEALVLTLLLATPTALALYSFGWLLEQPEGQPDVAAGVGGGLRAAALLLFALSMLRHTVRARGLAEAHFRWPTPALGLLRRNLHWFIPLVTPIAALVSVYDTAGDEASNASLGRVLFTLGLIALAVFLSRVVRPSGPALRRLLEENKTGWAYRLRHVWYPLLVLSPLVFGVLSWLGFHYTALRLESRFEESLTLAFVLMLANGLLLRWLFIARRSVAVENAKRRRAQAISDAAAKDAGSDPAPDSVALLDEEKVDLPALSVQTRQLFRAAIAVTVAVGLFVIWAEALPALRMFDRVQVWPSVQVIDTPRDAAEPLLAPAPATPREGIVSTSPILAPDTMLGAEHNSTPGDTSAPLAITLADLGLALLVLLVTIVTFRNVPGLIEIVVLQRLPLDAGSRYALSTVLRYTIAIIGVLIAFSTLGVSWAKVQWLAAALTFGLAFGLQEIFANFVSGLIILAERPIRLGDTVTVGGVTGTVTRIRMRATTIADWDLKELVIPNKTFITGDVINWSLSAPSLRVTIPVGVSYSSDVDKVEAILLKVAKASSNVLEDPKPVVVFKSFGDSTLDFQLRVYIPSIDFFVPIRHELHRAIIKAFRAAGVEIAFPQRDLHLRSIDDLATLRTSNQASDGAPVLNPEPPVRGSGAQDSE